MKTKVLFSAAIISTLFAACTNEDFIESPSNVVAKDGRPVVENVTLNFQKGITSNTRISFDQVTGNYSWTEDDVIGAILMDEIRTPEFANLPQSNPEKWNELTWFERYELTTYAHTSYPFAWDKEKEEWSSAAKMMEGNYFFVYPYENYEGKRQVRHSLTGQSQEGSTTASALKALEKNQYFVGYSQIKAGVENKDALKNVVMAQVLSPIRFRVEMVGTKTYTIQKVVVKGENLSSEISIDPTNAAYTGYNLTGGNVFNYANFIDAQGGNDLYDHTTDPNNVANWVYNIEDTKDYDKYAALLATVQSIGEDAKYAELIINNATPLSQAKGYVYGTIFVNSVGSVTPASEELKMDIYTDKGLIKDINLTQKNTEIDASKGQSAITDFAVADLSPTTTNYVKIQVADNSVDKPIEMEINNVRDLETFIAWNKDMNRAYTATLVNDVTLTADMLTALKAAKTTSQPMNKLVVDSETNGKKLIVAKEVAEDIFNYVQVTGDVQILGTATMEVKEKEIAMNPTGTLSVAEGATLNIGNINDELVIKNDGILNVLAASVAKQITLDNTVKGKVIVEGELQIGTTACENEGEITVNGTLKANGYLTNKNLITNNKDVWNLINGANGVLKTSTGVNHLNGVDAASTVWLTKLGDAITGGATLATGTVKYEAAISETVKTSDLLKVGKLVTELLFPNGGRLNVEVTSSGSLATMKKLTAEKGLTIEAGDYDGKDGAWQADVALGDFTLDATAEVNLTGTVNLNYIKFAVAHAVNVLDGTLVVAKSAEITGNLVLGSKKAFKKYGAVVDVQADATLTVAGNIEAGTDSGENTIKNNGTCKTTNYAAINGGTQERVTKVGSDLITK